VRGQFRGYRDEKGVAKDSQVETFAAMRLHIDTWRWAGVPFYIRTGKCLPISATEVIVNLKKPPLTIFDTGATMPTNYFRLRLSPEVVISTGALVKRNGEDMRGEPVELVARHSSQREKSPYERLLGDAIRGDTQLFTQDASVEAAWCVVDPVLTNPTPVVQYEPGSWGPKEAAGIVEGNELWHDPVKEQSQPC
jgi:glucose-6-phosphate 1-dehydrogenase